MTKEPTDPDQTAQAIAAGTLDARIRELEATEGNDARRALSALRHARRQLRRGDVG